MGAGEGGDCLKHGSMESSSCGMTEERILGFFKALRIDLIN